MLGRYPFEAIEAHNMPRAPSHIRVGCTFMRKELCKLSGNAQLAYIWLLSFCGPDPNAPIYPSQRTLSERMNVSRQTVVRALEELENARLIERGKQTRDSTRQRYLCSQYYVHRSV